MTTLAVRRTRPGRQVPPCARCGTRKGYIPRNQKSPARHNGVPYGYNGKLCKNCYSYCREAKQKAAGRVKPCKRRREQTYKVQRVMKKLARAGDVMTARQGLAEPDRQAMADARRWLMLLSPLPVLDPWFTHEQLSCRAKSRLLIREARKAGLL